MTFSAAIFTAITFTSPWGPPPGAVEPYSSATNREKGTPKKGVPFFFGEVVPGEGQEQKHRRALKGRPATGRADNQTQEVSNEMSDPVVNRGFFGKFMGSSFYKKFILPGLISQSVVIAGGYGTGRELVEYFGNFGSLGGILGMVLVTTVLWAIVYAVSFEFARTFKVYDYRSFFKELIGPGWMLYEVCYIILLLIILGVVGATSGSVFKQAFGLPPLVGAALFLAGVATLTFFGSYVIEVALSWWSFVLYAVFLLFLFVGLSKVGGQISANLASGDIREGWALGGFKYAFYNLGTLPAVLFALNYIETRREAIISGILTSVLTILPGFSLPGPDGLLPRHTRGGTASVHHIVPDRSLAATDLPGGPLRDDDRDGRRVHPRRERTGQLLDGGPEELGTDQGQPGRPRGAYGPDRPRRSLLRPHRPHRQGLRHHQLGLFPASRGGPLHDRPVQDEQKRREGIRLTPRRGEGARRWIEIPAG